MGRAIRGKAHGDATKLISTADSTILTLVFSCPASTFLCFTAGSRGVANSNDVLPDVIKRMRSEGQHARLLRQAGQSRRQIVGRSGTNVAKILRDDQVRSQRCEQLGVHCVNALAALHQFADLAVNFRGRGVRVHTRSYQWGLLRSRWQWKSHSCVTPTTGIAEVEAPYKNFELPKGSRETIRIRIIKTYSVRR